MPASGLQTELVPLLEDCTKAFAPGTECFEQYRDDVRYLRVWLLYADWVPEPRDIFAYLSANAIGRNFAVFYEAHATFLELRGSHEAARRVYDEGVEAMAQPIERLRTKRKGFEVRMAKRKARAAKAHSANAEAIAAPPPRAMLGDLRTRGGARRVGGGGGGMAGSEPAGGGNVAATPLEIFADDGASGGSSQPAAAAGPWRRLQTQRETAAENAGKPSTWAGTTLSGSGGASAKPAADALDIFVDPEFEGAAGQQEEQPKRSASRSFLDKCETRDRSESKAHASASQPVGVARLFAPKRKVPVYRTASGTLALFDPALLIAEDGSEVSFEERRVAMYMARKAAEEEAVAREREREHEAAASPSGSDDVEMDVEESPPAVVPEPPAPVSAAAVADENAAMVPPPVPVAAAVAQTPPAPVAAAAVEDSPCDFQIFGRQPSPTMNFRQAMQRSAADDMTINTQEAMDDIMSMFKEDLPFQSTMRAAAPAAAPAGPDATAEHTETLDAPPKPFSLEIFEEECPSGGGAGDVSSDAPLDVFEDLCAGGTAAGPVEPQEDSPEVPRRKGKPSRISMNPLFEVFNDADASPAPEEEAPAPVAAPVPAPLAIFEDDAENAAPSATDELQVFQDDNAAAAMPLEVFQDDENAALAANGVGEGRAETEGFSVTRVFRDIASTAEAPAEVAAPAENELAAPSRGRQALTALMHVAPPAASSAAEPWGETTLAARLAAQPEVALESLVFAGECFEAGDALDEVETGNEEDAPAPVELAGEMFIVTSALRSGGRGGARRFAAFATDDVTLAAMGLGNDDEKCTLALRTAGWVRGAWAHCVIARVGLAAARQAPRGFVSASQACFCFGDASVSRLPADPADGSGGLSLRFALRAYSVAGRTMPMDLAAFYTLRLLDGMAACHAAGFAHCGLQPEALTLLSVEVGATDWALEEPAPWKDIGLSLGAWETALELDALPAEAHGVLHGSLEEAMERMGAPMAPDAKTPAAIARALDAAAVVDVVYRMLHGADAAVRLETTAFDRPPDADVTSSALKLAEAVGADSDTPAWARELFSALLNNAAEGCCAPTVRAAREALASHLACRGRELRTAMAEHNVLLFDTCIA